MKIGKALAGGLVSLSLAAFAMPCWASTMSRTPGAAGSSAAAISTSSGTQIAFDDDVEEHHERHEKIERGRERAEQYTHSDSDEEHGGTRNFVRDHTPGTEEHEEHERREGEEHHSVHQHSDYGY
jgi:hypothetical protein